LRGLKIVAVQVFLTSLLAHAYQDEDEVHYYSYDFDYYEETELHGHDQVCASGEHDYLQGEGW
jgi:hypothetical protein